MVEFRINQTNGIIDSLLKMSKLEIPQLMLAMRNGITLVGFEGDREVGTCVTEVKKDHFEITHWAVLPEYQKKGYGRELMFQTLDYIRILGGRSVEAGVGNANIRLFELLQRIGFRVCDIVRDHYIYGNKTPEVENSILNRDMIRYRAEIKDIAGKR